MISRVLPTLKIPILQGNVIMRKEKDALGTVDIPESDYRGINTFRALENFPISGITNDPDFIKALVLIKKAAAKVNAELNQLDKNKSEAIVKACDELLEGKLVEYIAVDVYGAGAGTSFNMNVNEVLANRAIEHLKGQKGDYSIVHPNDHVNCAQSTNDVIPTALRIAALMKGAELVNALDVCQNTLAQKGVDFYHVIKAGRTHLQDAAPVSLGREFTVYSNIFSDHKKRIEYALEELKTLGIGGTAVGTGINTHPQYTSKMISELSKLTGINLSVSKDLMLSMQTMAPFVAVANAIENLSIDVGGKICGDLRLMSSGPTTGLSEINLPAVQQGSSIMPGKKNPSILEMLDQVCCEISGNALTVRLASQRGQFELNVFMPVIAFNLLHSVNILANALNTANGKCFTGITANEEQCKKYAESTVSLATVLNPIIGYAKAAELVKEAVKTHKTIRQLCEEQKILPKEELDKLFNLEKLAGI